MTKQTNKQTNLKKGGFSLIETMLVIVIGSLIMAGIIMVAMNSFKSADLMSSVSKNVETILKAANIFKSQSSKSDGTFENVNNKNIIQYLPENMYLDGTNDDDCIRNKSTGSQICYKIKADKITSNGDSVKVFVDFNKKLSSTEKLKRAELKIMDSISKYATSKDSLEQVGTASDIGDKDADFTTDGNAQDGLVGVRKIAQ